MKILIALLATCATSSAFAVPTYVNPFGERTRLDLSLQGVLDARGNTLVTVASDDQLSDDLDSWWTAIDGLNSSLVIELAGYAPHNAFGIYDAADPSRMTTIFEGSAAAGANSSLVTPYETFGFFLRNAVVGFTWYSDSTLNSGSLDHLVAYQGQGEILNLGPNSAAPLGQFLWDSNAYVFGWEDLSLGDQDYNDMIVAVANIRPFGATSLEPTSSLSPVAVPDGGATLALLAGALASLAGLYSRRPR